MEVSTAQITYTTRHRKVPQSENFLRPPAARLNLSWMKWKMTPVPRRRRRRKPRYWRREICDSESWYGHAELRACWLYVPSWRWGAEGGEWEEWEATSAVLGEAIGSLLEGIGGDRGRIAAVSIRTSQAVNTNQPTYQSRNDGCDILYRDQSDKKRNRNNPCDRERPEWFV